MRFECDFLNPDTGEFRTVTTTLEPNEIVSVESHACPDVLGKALAIARAYRDLVPAGFEHIRDGARLVMVN